MPSVLAEIRQWGKILPYWEQAALDKILAGKQLVNSDYDELLQYLLEDEGLAEPKGPHPKLQFNNEITTECQSPIGQLRLEKIYNMQNVNALIPKQFITFGPALTALFGANGSGKSGYARVLGCAGFTRGDKEVLPDIAHPVNTDTVFSAEFEISDGASTKIIHYQKGDYCPELATFYVFDSTSVKVHLTSNSLSFSPAGLSYLTELAEVTDKVREGLKARIESCNKPNDFLLLFQGNSTISELIADLGPETNLKELKRIAKLTQEEKKRITYLDVEIAKLKSQDIPSQVIQIKNTIGYLENLTKLLSKVEPKLSDEVINDICKSMKIYIERESAVQSISVDKFKSEHFTQTGSEIWYNFIIAAKALTDAEQTSEIYPKIEEHCPLCQQLLTTEASNLLLRLWAFLESETQTKLSEAKGILEDKRIILEQIDLDFFGNQSASYIYLHEKNGELLKQIEAFIQACNQRRDMALKIIDTTNVKSTIPKMPDNGSSKIELIIQTLGIECERLKKENPIQKIIEYEQELLNLRHLEIVGQNISNIELYIQNRVWAKHAKKIGGNTRHITQKYQELFERLVTDRYIELFDQTLKDLQHPLSVMIQTTGRKGKTFKQIFLKSNHTTTLEKITPEKVLSEGEKRATALADFLTEVTLDTTSSGIILDDPVTSLDLEWRETIASILIKKAKDRQVIVFTHDLPFLYHLKKYAERQTIDIVTHWIKRGDNDGKPGYVYLNNSPTLEQDYRKATKAYEIYKDAKNASAAKQESLLHEGFDALRSSYEAFIIFELFNKVVMRFDERISVGRLKDIVWNASIVNEIIDKYELLSKYIGAHLHSDAFAATKPTCEMLLKEIEDFKALKKKLSELKNG